MAIGPFQDAAALAHEHLAANRAGTLQGAGGGVPHEPDPEHQAAVHYLAGLHPAHPLVRLTHSLAVNSFGPYTGPGSMQLPQLPGQINSFGPYQGAPVPAPPQPQINSFPPYTGPGGMGL